MCRKFHGAAFSTFGQVLAENYQLITGEKQLRTYTAANGSQRGFCSCCGSSLTFRSKDANAIEVAIASLDLSSTERSPPLLPDAHVHVQTQVPWLQLTDQLPKHDLDRS